MLALTTERQRRTRLLSHRSSSVGATSNHHLELVLRAVEARLDQGLQQLNDSSRRNVLQRLDSSTSTLRGYSFTDADQGIDMLQQELAAAELDYHNLMHWDGKETEESSTGMINADRAGGADSSRSSTARGIVFLDEVKGASKEPSTASKHDIGDRQSKRQTVFATLSICLLVLLAIIVSILPMLWAVSGFFPLQGGGPSSITSASFQQIGQSTKEFVVPPLHDTAVPSFSDISSDDSTSPSCVAKQHRRRIRRNTRMLVVDRNYYSPKPGCIA